MFLFLRIMDCDAVVVYCSLGCGVKVRKMDMDLHQVHVVLIFRAVDLNPVVGLYPCTAVARLVLGFIGGAQNGIVGRISTKRFQYPCGSINSVTNDALRTIPQRIEQPPHEKGRCIRGGNPSDNTPPNPTSLQTLHDT